MGKGYSVLTITELMRPSDQGGVMKVYRHTIKTRGGTVLSVEVPDYNFTPEQVGPILEHAASNADAVKSL